MALPASFRVFTPPAKGRFKKVLIGTEGPANSGKTEFAMSAPGPGIFLALDRSYDATLDNPEPPETRNVENFVILPVRVAMPTAATQDQAKGAWREFYGVYTQALDNPDARTVVLDGDSDSFELQTLAEYGRTTQIPQIQRTSLNAARRAMIARAWDSGKIVIATNKLKKKYETQYNADGSIKMGGDGKPVREWDGVSYERQGFSDHEYLWQLQLKHHYDADKGIWGVEILMAKAYRATEGTVLWGGDCNLRTVLELVYPNVKPSEWGF